MSTTVGEPDLVRELAEARQQQAAMNEILHGISRSQGDVQPVLDMVVANAIRLCDATFAHVMLCREGRLELAARTACTAEFAEFLQRGLEIDRTTTSGRAARKRSAVQIADFMAERGVRVSAAHDSEAVRTVLSVPMLRAGQLVGVITVWRREVLPFARSQIALLQTFADQAVIAIENVRLFKELARRNGELAESLEQQSATSEILRAISSSPTDALPVFETIVRNAVTLCGSLFANVFRFDGELLHYVASRNTGSGYVELLESKYPMRPDMSQVAGRVILSGSTVRLEDAKADRDYDQRFPTAVGWRRMLGVPMLREGKPLGVIVVGWAESGPVPQAQEELLQTFADQALIAIENVRLFQELETRNRELTEALEQQTATSEILRAISRSPTDLQPVFDAIATAALKLCGASVVNLLTFDGELLHVGALVNIVDPEGARAARSVFPRRPGRDTGAGRAVLARKVVAIPDVLADPDYAF
jgi:GAF domain-containing protein